MIFLRLLYNFLIVGLFSLGGAYSAIPLIRDVARVFEVFTEEHINDFIGIAESTPGPIAVNLATYVGTRIAGIPGAIIATFAVVFPAFVIMIIFTLYFRNIFKNEKVICIFSIIRPCIVGIIMSAGLYLLFQNIGLAGLITKDYDKNNSIKACVIFVLILIIMNVYKKVTKKMLKAPTMIILGAIFGIAINAFV